VQEDVDAIGLSSYNGGHRVFFREVLAELRARGGADIPVFAGGGGTITAADARQMKRDGVKEIFFAGTSLDEIAKTIFARLSRAAKNLQGDRALGRAITQAEELLDTGYRKPKTGKPGSKTFVLGVAGPGGAGKSTLIDELTSRFLQRQRNGRIAILANDPSHADSGGAVLGDRVSMIYAQDDRVFFRSLATRGSPSGLSAVAAPAIERLRQSGEFDLIFVESVGIGQDSDPFGSLGRGPRLADAVLFVLPPHYGGRMQLQKIGLLSGADLVALNKCDQPMAHTAKTEIASRLAANPRPPPLHLTVAARHLDAGTDALYAAIEELAGIVQPGGEKPCHLEIKP
jgi:putative protein kinase ArgK-like GTPase of G3E family